jgi:apolipoprotein N-acyltransferase
VLQVLIFPSLSIFALSWIALVPLLIAILQPARAAVALIDPVGLRLGATTPWQGFWLGYITGIVWYAGSCFWVFYVMHVYGGVGTAAGIAILALFCLYLALYQGIFGGIVAAIGRRPVRGLQKALLLTPFIWVALEFARARISGFPWDLMGYSQVENVPLTRIATVTGVYGVSFLIVLVNCGIVSAIFAAPAHRRRYLGTAFAIAVMLQLGTFANPRIVRGEQRALLVQQNIGMDVQWNRESLDQTLNDLVKLSVVPGNTPAPRMIIWPESPAPFFDNDPDFRASMSGLAREQNASVIAGTVGELPAAPFKNQNNPELANRAVLVGPDGRWIASYDKIHLVPFGEYVPFKRIFGFASGLTEQVGNYVPGRRRSVFNVNGSKVGVFICYESIFPDEIRQFVANGAEVLVNISDDGWYGRYGAPGQHLNMARMRAIENGRWLLRATNTGVTASIDPFGRVLAEAPTGERTTLDAPYNLLHTSTVYTRYGDWFAWMCVIITLIGIFVRVRAGSIQTHSTQNRG